VCAGPSSASLKLRALLFLAAIAAVLVPVGVAGDAASTDRSLARTQDTAPEAAGTQTPRFKAWSADGEAAVGVRGRRRGTCNSSSFVNGRDDAWRCFVGRFILDPCFESPVAANRVLCVRSPWTRWAGWYSTGSTTSWSSPGPGGFRLHLSELLLVGVDDDLAHLADELAQELALRGYDAVHLASALTLGPATTLITWDVDLQGAAHRSGLAVAPAAES
jgi:hypothetical protein